MPESLYNTAKGGKGSSVDIGGRYAALASMRNSYLDRAKEYSRFTLPYVIPNSDDMDRGSGANQHGFQGLGAQAVNHLSNKITLTMFPAQSSYFKLAFDEEMKATLVAGGYDPTTLSELLVEAENRAATYQQKVAARVAYTESFKNLLISGNVLMYVPKDQPIQAIKLNRYVVQLDLSGKLTELVILHKKAFSTLTPDVKEGIKAIKGQLAPKNDDIVEIYTWVYRINHNTFAVTQSCSGIQIKDLQEIPEDQLPWIPLRWNACSGEDYGRGLVEDHAGDFYVIEFLSEAIAKGMALMADIKYLVKPGSVTDIDEVSTAPTGEWVFGNLDDIGILQLEKFADFTPISTVLDRYERRIGQAFLMNSAVRRDAERVTTVELRIDAQEMEVSLGGQYSLFAQTYQNPLTKLYLQHIGFPLFNEVVPTIVTGLAALGKVGDLDKIQQFTEMMQMPQTWPMPVQDRMKWHTYAREVAAGLSMKLGFMMTDDEYAEKQKADQAAQQNQAMQDAAVNSAPDIVKSQMEGGIQ